MSDYSLARERSNHRGVALVAVLYFLVVCALTITAVLFAQRSAKQNALSTANGTQLLAAAEAALHSTVGSWSSTDRRRQAVGSTAASVATINAGVRTTTYITRLTSRVFSITSEAIVGGNIARRVSLLVRLPFDATRVHGALISAVDVTIGAQVRFATDSTPCDTASAAVVLTPNAALAIDADIPPGSRPSVWRDSIADDSSIYLRAADTWWSELAQRADIRLAADAHITPTPIVVAGQCRTSDTNWGDPLGLIAECADRAPLVYVPGDLTIDGGAGQGVLLVDGHLAIAGPFTFSGQIVARHGIETLADNIAISGEVYAWRASSDTSVSHTITSDVRLTHATTLRYSGCDARHGIASWLQPRRVRQRAWSELF
jgi:Tfp pilus assembly protein PilX